MKFYYDEINAAKYQLLNFPRLYWVENYIPDDPSFLRVEGFSEEEKIMDITEQWMRDMGEALKPFGRDIEKYYGQTWHDINVFNLLMKVVDLFREETVFTWLDSTMEKDEELLRIQMLIMAMQNMEDEQEKEISTQNMEEITAVAKDISKWSSFLENTLLPKEECWRILQFLMNPLEHVRGFSQLLRQIEPLYLQQKDYIQKAHEEGKKITFELNKDIKYLKVSYSLQSDELYREIEQDGKIRVLSFLIPSSVNVNNKPPFMAVGYQVTFIMDVLLAKQKNLHRNQAEIFKVLGDGTRYELFVLVAQGVDTTKELAEKLGISGASVTYHIQMLVENNLLHANWRKKPLRERINREKILALGKQLKEDLFIGE